MTQSPQKETPGVHPAWVAWHPRAACRPVGYYAQPLPTVVVIISHTQRKLIQPNVALLLFEPVALDAISLKKRMSGRSLLRARRGDAVHLYFYRQLALAKAPCEIAG